MPVIFITNQCFLLQLGEFVFVLLSMMYCICGYFRGGFIFVNFTRQTSQKYPLQFMSIYSNENIRKIMKLSPRKFPHLVQNRENYGVYSIFCIYEIYLLSLINVRMLSLNITLVYYSVILP